MGYSRCTDENAPTGPTGPAGLASAPAFNPNNTSSYQPGQIVIGPDGMPYVIQNANPTGTPGSSPSYKPLSGTPGATGPTGPAGLASAPAFNPNNTASYQPGQIVMGPDGVPYVVQNANPTGTPGSSPSYKPLSGAQGPVASFSFVQQPLSNHLYWLCARRRTNS